MLSLNDDDHHHDQEEEDDEEDVDNDDVNANNEDDLLPKSKGPLLNFWTQAGLSLCFLVLM